MVKILQKVTAVFAVVILLASALSFGGDVGLFADAIGEYLDPFDYLFDDRIIGVTDIDAYSYDTYVLDSLENYYDYYQNDDIYHNDGPDIEFDDITYSIVAVESSDPSVVEVDDFETGGYVLKAKDSGSAVITIYHYGEVYNQKPSDDQIYLGNYDTFTINVEPVPETEVTVSGIQDYNYTGKDIKPAIKLTYKDTTLKEGSDYTVFFDGNREVGTASVEILLSGGFTGMISEEFRIRPTINKTSAVLYYGTNLNLKVNSSESVVWKTKNKAVAKVSSSGVVTPVKEGTAVITATTGGYTLSCTVTVKKRQLNVSAKTLYVGQKLSLTYLGGTGTVTWKSSDKNLASVSKTGVVTALKAGKVTITATRNKVPVTCTVTVKKRQLNVSDKTLYVGQKLNLTYLGGTGTVTWKSSDKSLASVSKTGVVTALKKGKVTITATRNKVPVTCTVSVINQKLSSTKLTLKLTKTADLDLKGAVSNITWTSSNPKVASVNKNGLVKGLKKGTAVITAKHAGISYKCTVTVK